MSLIPQVRSFPYASVFAEKISEAISFDYLLGSAINFSKTGVYNNYCEGKDLRNTGETLRQICEDASNVNNTWTSQTWGESIWSFTGSTLPAATASLLGRYVAKSYNYPVLGGAIFGGLKGIALKDYIIPAAYSGVAYELYGYYSNINPHNLFVSTLSFMAIEALGGIINEISKSYAKSGEMLSFEEINTASSKGITEGAFAGILVSGLGVIASPLFSQILALPVANIVTGLAALGLTGYAGYQTIVNFDNLRNDETSLIHWLDQNKNNFLIDLPLNTPYRVISQLYDRPYQFVESMGKLVYRGLNWKYTKSISPKESAIDLKLINASDYLIYSLEAGLNMAPEVKLKSSYIMKTDEDNRFGDFSGMTVDDEGNFILVSDTGAYLKATPEFENGVLKNFHNSIIGTFTDAEHKPLSKMNSDIEEVIFYNGNCIVSHERINSLKIYEGCDLASSSRDISIPDEIKGLPNNEGIEAFGISKVGQILAIAEYDYDGSKSFKDLHPAFTWLTGEFFDSMEDLKKFYYKSSEGYGVSGMTFLSNDGALVLERAYNKHSMFAEKYWIKLKFVSAQSIIDVEEDGVIEGVELLSIEDTIPHQTNGKYSLADNYESVAAIEARDHGVTEVFIASDSNRAPFEKDFLLQFEIPNHLLEL